MSRTRNQTSPAHSGTWDTHQRSFSKREFRKRSSGSDGSMERIARDEAVEISLIVPALNEEDNLEELVEGLQSVIKRHQLAAEVLIVDDASTDNTFMRATRLAENHPFVKPLHKGPPRGMELSIWYGIQHAQGKVGVVVMADHVDPIETIPVFRDKVIKEGYDLVLLSRWTNRGDTEN